MKLENNSLKYGINAYNGVQGAYNNAYQQEMENQRNMQGQTTQRQKTLLEAVKDENQQRLAFQQAYFGYAPKTGTTIRPMDEANLRAYRNEVNANIQAGLEPNTALRAEIYDTMPKELFVNANGEAGTRYTPFGFSRVTPQFLNHPDVTNKAAGLNITPADMLRRYEPGTRLPSMED